MTVQHMAALGGHWALAVSLGTGLMIGIERERTKGTGADRRPAGVRTFALVGLLGGVCAVFDDAAVLAVGAAFVALAGVAAYLRSPREDPGMTTEVALLVTFLIGALAIEEPTLAAALGVVVTILLASRTRLHAVVSNALTERELHDGLVFAAAALVVLPLVPNRPVGPYGVFNPFTVWRLVVLVMAIGAAGYVARRLLGPRFGLPVAGLAGGFVSASATIGSMAGLARREPEIERPAFAGAMLANVATIALMMVLLAGTSPETLQELALPLAAAGVVALAVGGWAVLRVGDHGGGQHDERGRAFDLRGALVFAVTLTGVLLVSAAVTDRLGAGGLVVATAVAGFADTHSAAISAAALVASGDVSADQAAVAILAGLTTNTVTKIVLARVSGTGRFAARLVPGVVAIVAAAWGVSVLTG